MPKLTIRFDVAGHEKQEKVLRSTSPTIVFRGGAGSGKTYIGVVWSIMKALSLPNSRGMVISATYRMLQQSVWPHLQYVLEQAHLHNLVTIKRGHGEIWLPNGSMFWLRSAEHPESLLGADLAWLWGDEVALWRPDAYRYAISRLRQPGFEHQALFTFTPKGMNWTAEELGKPRDGLEVIEVTTADNPGLTQDFLERLKREYGEGTLMWRQEVLGEFVAFEGLVYPEFDQATHVDDPPNRERFVDAIAGVDWGWTNPGAIVVVARTADDTLWVVDEVYETRRSIEWWVEQAHRLAEEWPISSFACDPSEPANIATMRRAGLPARGANNAIQPGLAAVASRLARGALMISPRCANVIREMLQYHYQTIRGQQTDRPAKLADHCMDALRYAVMETARGTGPTEIVVLPRGYVNRDA